MSQNSFVSAALNVVAVASFCAAVVGFYVWKHRRRVRARDAQSLRVEQTVAPRLGGSFHQLDSDGLLALPFLAFTQWGALGRRLENVVTYTGPFGFAAHAFDYAFNERAIVSDGTPVPVFDQRYLTPVRYSAAGVLVGLPHLVPTAVVTSFPARAASGAVRSQGWFRPLPTIPPGATADQAFAWRFRTAGDPQTLAILLTPGVKDGLLRGPPGVHVELFSGWLLAVTPAFGASPDNEVATADWANWFATQLPLDRLPAPAPPGSTEP